LDVLSLPHLNAGLNGAAAIALGAGYLFIRRGRIAAHLACMVGALAVSAAFLVSYLIYHYHVGSVAYQGEGWIRTAYFAILISHSVLAAVVPPLALVTVYRAWRRQFTRHRGVARWTVPVWLYVSVTGIVVYLMLYRMP
jgi:putative membrane protein